MMIMKWMIKFMLLSHFCNISHAMIVWNTNAASHEGKIKIKHNLVKIASEQSNNTEFEDHQRKLVNISLDERCKSGKDLSIAFQLYRPYVNTQQHWESIVLTGIIPTLLTDILKYCCPFSEVTFGELYNSIKQAEDSFDEGIHMDFTFPVYGLQGLATTKYKDNPFIPLVQAPRMVLLVPEALFENKNTRTKVLLQTFLNSWPMLLFISLSACLSGLVVWFLDRNKNPGEFPPSFFVGAWEGFWWAFVTMTTVGYGDRSPKSILARIFCIFWILCGIILVSLFTGLVTAALSISATPVYNIPGAKIGAVSGSKEYQIGVGLNADMSAFAQHHELIDNLTTNQLHGGIIDNFILSSIQPVLQKEKLRIEREFPYSVTYGVAISEDAKATEKCFRKYVHHYPQRIFETISKELKPVKNPTDDVRVEVLAAEKLFYEEAMFKLVVYVQAGCLGAFIVGGMVWEFFVRNKPTGKYGLFHTTARKKREDKECGYPLQDHKEPEQANTELDLMIDEYNSFHGKWVARLQLLKTDLKEGINGNTNI